MTNNIFEELKRRWVESLVGNDAFEVGSKEMQKLQRKKDDNVRQLLQTIQVSEDKETLWVLKEVGTSSAELDNNYQNLLELSVAYQSKHSQFYHHKQLLNVITDSLDWLLKNKYHQDVEAYGNWWNWEIGIPRNLNDILVLLYEEIPAEKRKAHLAAIQRFVPDPYKNNRSVRPFKTVNSVGANQVDIGLVKIIQNILLENEEEVQKAIRALDKLFVEVLEGDGFYHDGSFIQHGCVPYNGSYGLVFLEGISKIVELVEETSFSFEKKHILQLNNWLKKSYLPFMNQGSMMDMVRGRGISREYYQSIVAGTSFISSLLRLLPFLPKEDQVIYTSYLQDWFSIDYVHDFYFSNVENIIDLKNGFEILKQEKIKKEKQSFLHNFYKMDRVVYRNDREDFTFGLSYSSKRTIRYETMNKENGRGWYTGDGMFYLYQKDPTTYNEGYWGTIDPYYIPGTTVLNKKLQFGEDYQRGKTFYAGGVTFKDKYGSFGFQYESPKGDLKGNKAYVILNDKILFAGCNITWNQGEAYTTIDQRKLTGTENVYVNGERIDFTKKEWLKIKDVQTIYIKGKGKENSYGFAFPTLEDLEIRFGLQKGNWAFNNASNKDQEIERYFLTIVKKHQELNDTYQYWLIPSQNEEYFYKKVKGLPLVAFSARNSILVEDKKEKVTTEIRFEELDEPAIWLDVKEGSQKKRVFGDPTQQKNQWVITI